MYVAGLREEIVTGADHVLELLSTGEAARHIGETKMNKASSRSHTVFRMVQTPSPSFHPQVQLDITHSTTVDT